MTDSGAEVPVPAAIAVLPVSELDRALAWYGRLGFTVQALFDGYAILEFEGAEVHLAEDPDLLAGTSRSVCYLRVADAAATYARWMALAVPEVAPLGRPARALSEFDLVEFVTEDPDSNRWRVCSPAPAAPPAALAAVDGGAGTTDESWRDIVALGTCAGCGLTATDGDFAELGGCLRDEAQKWATLLATADDHQMRARPTPDRWSALEYAAHVRDLLPVMAERTMRTLVEDEPELGWWDQEAALADSWANESDGAAVAEDIARNAAHFGQVLDHVPADGWERTATRGGTDRFTVELLARYALHEMVHHRADALHSLGAASPS